MQCCPTQVLTCVMRAITSPRVSHLREPSILHKPANAYLYIIKCWLLISLARPVPPPLLRLQTLGLYCRPHQLGIPHQHGSQVRGSDEGWVLPGVRVWGPGARYEGQWAGFQV